MLEPLVEAVVAWFPLRPVKAWVAGFVRKLPPAATLVVFAVPAAVLFPLLSVAVIPAVIAAPPCWVVILLSTV